jgi:hypothetical protein
MRGVLLLGAFALLAAPARAGYDDAPAGLVQSSATLAHVRAIYDRAHAREYSRNLTIIEDWRLFQNGTVGAYRVYRLGRDEREITTLGPLVYEKGVLHGIHWEHNRNGITYTYPGVHEARDAATERALRDPTDDRDVRVVGDSLALNAYVVEVNPPAGRRTWYFIDKRSGFVLRRESVQRHRRFVTTYDDYRIVDGVGEPSRIRTVDSLGNEREQILVGRAFDQTPDSRDVEMPPSRHLVEFPEQRGAVRFPLRIINGLPVVRVMVGHGAYDFLLDSGAAGIVVDPSVVDQQNLERYGRRIGATLGSFPETSTIVPQMSVGTLRMRNVVARVVGVPFHIDNRTRLAGMLGFDFFADAVVHIDLAQRVAEAYPPERFRAPVDTVAIPLGLDDKTPAVHVHAGSASARVVLDSGANRSIFESGYADRADFGGERSTTMTRVRGVGGYARAETERVPVIALAGIDMRNAAVDVTNADLGSDDLDGIVGTDLLRSYDLWFDYKTNAVYVRRTPPPGPPPTAQAHKR